MNETTTTTLDDLCDAIAEALIPRCNDDDCDALLETRVTAVECAVQTIRDAVRDLVEVSFEASHSAEFLRAYPLRNLDEIALLAIDCTMRTQTNPHDVESVVRELGRAIATATGGEQ